MCSGARGGNSAIGLFDTGPLELRDGSFGRRVEDL